jgi:glycosyltransferase involved in cell wall biosynthesis
MADQPHILIIPSEEYVPAHEPLAGIFQKNQVDALRQSNRFHLGVLSVRLERSWPMYFKAFVYRMAGRRVGNVLGAMGTRQLWKDLSRRARGDGDCLTISSEGGVNLVRSTGLYLLPPNPALDPRWWVAAGLAGYRRYVERFGRPDLIHAHNALSAGLLAARIRRLDGTPYVLTEHSSYYHQGLSPRLLRGAVRHAIEEAERHTVVSTALRRSLELRLGAIQTSSDLLPNVLPAAFEIGAPSSARAERGGFTVVCVGNFLPVKGHEHLLRAFATFQADHAEARLRLIGGGPLREQLEALAKDLGLGTAVSFLGPLSADEVRREMQTAQLLALPSLYETFGVVLIEAMACGLPILATRCGGPDDIVDEHSGWLVAPGDDAALAGGLEEAYRTRGHIDAARVRERCLARYGRAAFAQRANEIYETALHG